MPFVLGLILLAGFSQHASLPLGFLQSSTDARQQQQLLSNCTTAGSNVKCNCPQAPNITQGASSSTVLQLANKVSVATVDKVLGAAASDRPADQIVRVRGGLFCVFANAYGVSWLEKHACGWHPRRAGPSSTRYWPNEPAVLLAD